MFNAERLNLCVGFLLLIIFDGILKLIADISFLYVNDFVAGLHSVEPTLLRTQLPILLLQTTTFASDLFPRVRLLLFSRAPH